MEGLILLGVYVVLAAVAEVIAIGIGLIVDEFNKMASVIVFFVCSAVFLPLAWPIAVRVSKRFGPATT